MVDGWSGARLAARPGRWWRSRRVAEAVLAVLLVAAVAGLLHWGRGWGFFLDEWDLIAYRRSGGLEAFFSAHNGHLLAVPVLLYRALFAAVGLGHYWPYQLVAVGLHAGLVAMVFLYARARVPAWVAVAVSVPILLMAQGWQVLFWMASVGFILPLIVLVGILWLDPGRREPARDVVIAALLLVALATSGLGLSVLIGTAWLVWSSRDRLRRAWVVAVPGALWALWWLLVRPTLRPPAALRDVPGADPLGDFGSTGLQLGNVADIPVFAVRLAKATADGLLAPAPGHHWFPLIFVAAVLVALAVRGGAPGRSAPAVTLTLASYWASLGLARAHVTDPTVLGASRYLYPGAVLLVLLFAELARDLEWRPTVVAVTVLAAGVIGLQDVTFLDRFSQTAAEAFAADDARLRAVRCDPEDFAPSDQPLPDRAPRLTVGVYLSATDALGVPEDQRCRGQGRGS